MLVEEERQCLVLARLSSCSLECVDAKSRCLRLHTGPVLLRPLYQLDNRQSMHFNVSTDNS
jgi:hypothetical protein